jgi:hypothetical protein
VDPTERPSVSNTGRTPVLSYNTSGSRVARVDSSVSGPFFREWRDVERFWKDQLLIALIHSISTVKPPFPTSEPRSSPSLPVRPRTPVETCPRPSRGSSEFHVARPFSPPLKHALNRLGFTALQRPNLDLLHRWCLGHRAPRPFQPQGSRSRNLERLGLALRHCHQAIRYQGLALDHQRLSSHIGLVRGFLGSLHLVPSSLRVGFERTGAQGLHQDHQERCSLDRPHVQRIVRRPRLHELAEQRRYRLQLLCQSYRWCRSLDLVGYLHSLHPIPVSWLDQFRRNQSEQSR